MKTYETDTPSFYDALDILETTDRAHADNFNKTYKELFENTLYIAEIIEELASENTIETAFNSVFQNITETTDPTAMTSDEVETALNTEWTGESSPDPTAMQSSDVEDALTTEWNGESSSDPDALNAEEIEEVTT